MLRSTFRYFQPASLFIVLPLLLTGLWLPQLITPVRVSDDHAMPLFFLLAQVHHLSPWIASVTGLLLVWAQAILLNSIVNRYEMFSQRTSMGALIFVLVVSSLPGLRGLHPVHPAGLLVLAALYRLFMVYRQHRAYAQVFDAGALMALSSFFYLPCLLLVPVLWIFLLIMRPFIWREYVLSVVGLLLPYIFLGTIYFLFDSLDYLWYDLIINGLRQGTFYLQITDRFLLVLLWLMVALLIFSVPGYLSLMSRSIVRSQNLQLVITWMFLIAAGAVVKTGINVPADYAFVAIPFTIPVAHFFYQVRRTWVADLLLAGWVLLIVFQGWNQ